MREFYDVFISYGRADSRQFAEKLCDRLTALNLTVWFDQNDIPPSVDYQKEIDAGIERSHNFIFIIAPHSVKSPYCRKEINLAVECNKRIIPLLHVNGDRTQMHPAIRKFNWINFQEEIDDFEKSFQDLIRVIQNQSDYVEKHTYFLVKALEWERHQKRHTYLLIGKERQQAEDWLKREFKIEQNPCSPTDLHCEFICESTKNADNLMAQVLIIHASRDAKIAESITKSLMRNHITVWRKQTDLKTGIEHQDSIKQGIEESDNIIFLLSTYSLNSSHCLQERSYAISLNKRLITVRLEKLQREEIPEEIRAFQSLSFTDYEDETQYQLKIQQLVKELQQDALYFEQHKILLTKALKWKMQNSNPSILLRGYNLRYFESWLKVAKQRSEHPPLPLHEEFIAESLRQPTDLSLEVFISYSRSDSDFARRLNDTLQELGKPTWFDQQSIASGADFQQEIERGIEQSDNFLFIISERSITSPYCVSEVEYAQKLNKRFIPVIYEETPKGELPSPLAKIQWIDFKKHGGDFYANFSELVRALETDRDHVQSHTKWSLKAMEWDEKGREDSLLLRGSSLQEAQSWWQEWQEKSRGKKPEPTELQKEYIQRSEQAQREQIELEKVRQRAKKTWQAIAVTTLSLGLVVTSLLSAAIYKQYQQAKEDEVKTIANASKTLLLANNYLQALVEAIRAKQQSRHLNQISNNTQNLVESALQQAMYEVQASNSLSGHKGWVNDVAWNPDGTLLASASADKTIKLYKADGTLLKTLGGHDDWVNQVVWSPDGKTLASASSDKTVKLWRVDGTLLTTLNDHRDWVYQVVWSPDGKTLASTSRDKTIKLWTSDGTLLKTLTGHQEGAYQAVWSPDGEMLASASGDATIKLWKADGTLVKTLTDHHEEVNQVAWSPDGKMLASASGDATIKLWKADGTLVKTLTDHHEEVNQVVWSPDGTLFASTSFDRTIKLWKADGTLVKTLKGHQDWVTQVAWSPNGQILVSVAFDKTIKLWTLDGTLLKTLIEHHDLVNRVAWNPDSTVLASASRDKTIKFWKADRTLLQTLSRHRKKVKQVVWSPNGQKLASVSEDKTIELWRSDGTWLTTLIGHQDWVTQVAWNPAGNLLTSASDDKTIKLWKSDGTLIKTLRQHHEGVYQVVWSPNGQRFASASGDKTIKLWEADGTLLKTLKGHREGIYQIIWSPNGQRFASVSDDQTIKVWHADGTLAATLRRHPHEVYEVVWSPDSTMLASTSGDQTIEVWHADGTLRSTLSQHQGWVYQVVWSPDSKTLASASEDKTIKLWKPDGTLLKTLTGHEGWVNQVVWNSDGTLLASASGDNTIKLWSADGTLLKTLLSRDGGIDNLAWNPHPKLKILSFSVGSDVLFARLNETPLTYACNWVWNYLKHNVEVEAGDRYLCDNVNNRSQLQPPPRASIQ